jgi:hypothetical protein
MDEIPKNNDNMTQKSIPLFRRAAGVLIEEKQ